MKYHLLLFLIVNTIRNIDCHVIQRVKNSEKSDVMARLYLGNETIYGFEEIKKNNETNNVPRAESHVYLDDVLFMLKGLDWSEAEQPCLDHVYKMLHGLQNFTLWAVWDWDTESSEPQGLLYGNKYQLGNFDQCMKAPWSDTHPELRNKYCLADIRLERTDNSVRRKVQKAENPYQSALDYLESCESRTVEKLLGVLLSRSHLGAARMRASVNVTEPCQHQGARPELDGLFYAFMTLAGLLILISLICTFLNGRSSESTLNTKKKGFIRAFCLKENAKDLLKMRKEGIEVLYGIRFLTICRIVFDHQIGIYNAGPVSDGLSLDQDALSPLGLLVLHDDLFVDSFFMLSGFLTMATLVKFKKLPNLFLVILKRYLRLVVGLAVVVFFVCAVFPHMGSGPLWTRAVAHETKPCRENWWLNLLMVNNYVNSEDICIVVSWYIPCDFHFFVATVLVYYLYRSFPRLSLTVAGILTIGSVILPGVINYVNQLSPVQLFTFEFVSDPRANEEFHMTYIKSHTRYSAYLVGLFSGYLYAIYSADGNMNRIKTKWAVLGACFAVILMLVVMVTGSMFLWRSYHPLEGAIYAALNRPAWAFGVALLVLCCTFGHVPLVKSFLSWYPWVPLSRLAYGLYLTHTVLITRNVFITRNPQNNDYFEIVNSGAGVIVWGCIGALLLWLLAEAPANKLLMLCFQSKINKISATLSSNQETNVESIGSTPTSRLQDNLPTTIHYASKI